ncbi:hypothetical protein C2E23DRAFT_265393 [Lenzites betulinus]|nr:hypothetical protein C2E23DRAFT_265393 [Lenzites betulinus]
MARIHPHPRARDPRRKKTRPFARFHGHKEASAQRPHARDRHRVPCARFLVGTLWCTIGARPHNCSPIREDMFFVKSLCFHAHLAKTEQRVPGSRRLCVPLRAQSRVHVPLAPCEFQSDPGRASFVHISCILLPWLHRGHGHRTDHPARAPRRLPFIPAQSEAKQIGAIGSHSRDRDTKSPTEVRPLVPSPRNSERTLLGSWTGGVDGRPRARLPSPTPATWYDHSPTRTLPARLVSARRIAKLQLPELWPNLGSARRKSLPPGRSLVPTQRDLVCALPCTRRTSSQVSSAIREETPRQQRIMSWARASTRNRTPSLVLASPRGAASVVLCRAPGVCACRVAARSGTKKCDAISHGPTVHSETRSFGRSFPPPRKHIAARWHLARALAHTYATRSPICSAFREKTAEGLLRAAAASSLRNAHDFHAEARVRSRPPRRFASTFPCTAPQRPAGRDTIRANHIPPPFEGASLR